MQCNILREICILVLNAQFDFNVAFTVNAYLQVWSSTNKLQWKTGYDLTISLASGMFFVYSLHSDVLSQSHLLCHPSKEEHVQNNQLLLIQTREWYCLPVFGTEQL